MQSVYIRNQAHGYTEHKSKGDTPHRTACGKSTLNGRETKPDTRHSSLYVFHCERCFKKEMM